MNNGKTIYYLNGNPMYYFSQNKRTGHQIGWYENGNKREEYYCINYLNTGIVQTWNEDSSRIYIGNYKLNKDGPQIKFYYKQKLTTIQRFLKLWKL
jgi:antitoxin component YwqK of YwqJK toxin-antitoxin module